jgi:hypothetical protein
LPILRQTNRYRTYHFLSLNLRLGKESYLIIP